MKFACALSGTTIALALLAASVSAGAAVPVKDAGSFETLSNPDTEISTTATGNGADVAAAKPTQKSVGQITIGLPIPPIPEPGTTAMMIAGIAALGAIVARRRNPRG